jgi:hypothetical protein
MSDLKRKREDDDDDDEDALGGLMGTYASSDEDEGGLKLSEHQSVKLMHLTVY